ncbi:MULTISPECIES: WYL domain-containing protein [unclassified Nocardiopsis]|uniref:WYL domain-containing protein n=1 Tax=Nocardiopsis TaxID=2013 RepID=UPI00387B2705
MRTNTNQAKTLGHILRSMDRASAVTLRYVASDGKVSRRQVEVHAIEVTAAGDLVIRAHDRRSGTARSFRLDRVTHIRCHRVAHLADYRCPVTPVADQVTADELGDVVAVRGWTSSYTLAA